MFTADVMDGTMTKSSSRPVRWRSLYQVPVYKVLVHVCIAVLQEQYRSTCSIESSYQDYSHLYSATAVLFLVEVVGQSPTVYPRW